jgi:hypothetical protein
MELIALSKILLAHQIKPYEQMHSTVGLGLKDELTVEQLTLVAAKYQSISFTTIIQHSFNSLAVRCLSLSIRTKV